MISMCILVTHGEVWPNKKIVWPQERCLIPLCICLFVCTTWHSLCTWAILHRQSYGRDQKTKNTVIRRANCSILWFLSENCIFGEFRVLASFRSQYCWITFQLTLIDKERRQNHVCQNSGFSLLLKGRKKPLCNLARNDPRTQNWPKMQFPHKKS